jgi:hypothetical protein
MERLVRERIELAALERAAELRPADCSSASSTRAEKSRKGRQPGAISYKWRQVLKGIVERNGSASLDDVVVLARKAGLAELSRAYLLRRLRLFEERNLVICGADESFAATPFAVERYKL